LRKQVLKVVLEVLIGQIEAVSFKTFTSTLQIVLFLHNNIDAEDVSVGIVGRGHYDTRSKWSPDILRMDQFPATRSILYLSKSAISQVILLLRHSTDNAESSLPALYLSHLFNHNLDNNSAILLDDDCNDKDDRFIVGEGGKPEVCEKMTTAWLQHLTPSWPLLSIAALSATEYHS